jgi:ankyrin repeat protein
LVKVILKCYIQINESEYKNKLFNIIDYYFPEIFVDLSELKKEDYSNIKSLILRRDKDLSNNEITINEGNNNNNELFNLIIENKEFEIKQVLDKFGKNIKDIENMLFYAAQFCTESNVIDILNEYQQNKDMTNTNNSTALHIACKYNNYKAVPKLVTKNNINLKNNDNQTPFEISIKKENYECSIALLSTNYENFINFDNINNEEVSSLLKYMIKKSIKNEKVFKKLIEICNASILWSFFKKKYK